MEKPTKALLPEIFNTETDEDFAKVIEEAATVYANLIVSCGTVYLGAVFSGEGPSGDLICT